MRQYCRLNMSSFAKIYFIFACAISVASCIKWDVFSTKTLYKWAVNVNQPLVSNSEYSISLNNSQCKAIHASGVFRHGARNPSDMEAIRTLHTHIVREKNSNAFPDLDTWIFNYNLSLQGQLASEGISELFELGQRFATRFAALLNNRGNKEYRSSRYTRAQDSSKYFYQGMADVLNDMDGYANKLNDTLLRFYEKCPTYVEQLMRTAAEFHKFDNTTEFQDVAEALRKRLGMADLLSSESSRLILSYTVRVYPKALYRATCHNNNINISASDDIYLVYDMCSQETYIHGANDSVWCRLMTDAERNVIEYGRDIEWYGVSYGGRVNSKLPCPLVKDILMKMEKISNLNVSWDHDTPVHSPDYVSGNFYFGHSETVVQLMTALGLFKDDQPVLASNMAAMQNRKFRSSDLFPFSSNVVFAMYACDGATKMDATKFVVKLFVNEEAVVIPACGRDTCMLEDVVQAYRQLVDNCDLGDICHDDSTAGPPIVG